VLDIWSREPQPPEQDGEPEARTRADRAPAGEADAQPSVRPHEDERALPDRGQYITYPGEGR